jgi:hypothetical protein
VSPSKKLKYNGPQSKIIDQNSLAIWVPYTPNSLNLVRKAAAECCPTTISLLDFLEAIFIFIPQHTVIASLLNVLSQMKIQPEYVFRKESLPINSHADLILLKLYFKDIPK